MLLILGAARRVLLQHNLGLASLVRGFSHCSAWKLRSCNAAHLFSPNPKHVQTLQQLQLQCRQQTTLCLKLTCSMPTSVVVDAVRII